MKVFTGIVATGYGLATPNLAPVVTLIEARTGLTNLAPGTLNVKICEEYIVQSDAVINSDEYPFNRETNLGETIKIQRCLVAGYKTLIIRPDSHEIGAGRFHGKSYLELMGQKHFRTLLGLADESVVEVQVEGDADWWRSGI
jgi:CTP-dependent riboflavin kinase